MLGVDQAQVVDAGGGLRRFGRGLGAGLGVRVAGDLVRQRAPVVGAVGADPDVGQVERVEDQLNLAADQQRVDLVAVPP